MRAVTPSEWLTLSAIILGPILALWMQRVLDGIRGKKNQRLQLFLTLMGTRATPLSTAHVNALNAIDSVFNRKRDRKVREAWEKTLLHIGKTPAPPDTQQWQQWVDRLNDLKIDLYQVMGKAVGYTYSADYLKRQIYLPRGFTDSEAEAGIIRQTLAKALIEGAKVRLVPDAPAAHPAPAVGTEKRDQPRIP